ncbi:MAG: glycine betaine ABC transporter substrate-binding protein, partial [Bacteroidota bacterium]
IVTRKGFTEERPALGKFFANFNLEEMELYDLMDAIDKADDPLEAAEKWYQENKKLVESWMPDEMNTDK